VTQDAVARMLNVAGVRYAENNQMRRTLQTCFRQTDDVPWGIDRIDRPAPVISGEYDYSSDAEGTGVVFKNDKEKFFLVTFFLSDSIRH
jgi:hypothetical protein